MKIRLRRFAPLLVLLATLLPGRAEANTSDFFGAGSRPIAMGGAYSALTDDCYSAFYNPAASVYAEKFKFSLSYFYSEAQMKINGSSFEMDDSEVSGVTGGMVHSGELFGRKMGVSMFFRNHDTAGIRVIGHSVEQPRFTRISNSLQIFEFWMGFGVEIFENFSMGGGFRLAGDFRSRHIDIDINVLTGDASAPFDTEIRTDAAPNAGVFYSPTDNLNLALTFRGQIDLDANFDILLDLHMPDPFAGINITTQFDLIYDVFWNPYQLTLGAAFAPTEALTFTADVTWADWSKYVTASPDAALIPGGPLGFLLPPLRVEEVPRIDIHDTVEGRVGVEYIINMDEDPSCALRGGYAFVPAAIDEQTGLTNYLDNHKHYFSLGGGVRFMDPTGNLIRPIDVDLHYQLVWFAERDHEKTAGTAFPVGDIRASGFVHQLGITLAVRF